MAEQIISPGVFLNENVPVTTEAPIIPAGAAIIGPTVLGPVEIPTIITTYSEFKQKFGSTFISGGVSYSFFTSIAAQKFFQNGGQRLLVTRLAKGAYTSATSTNIVNDKVLTPSQFSSASFVNAEGIVEDKETKFTYNGTLVRFLANPAAPLPQDITTGTTQLYHYLSGSTLTNDVTNLRNKINASLGLGFGETPSSSLGRILTASSDTTTLSISGAIDNESGIFAPVSSWSGTQISTGSGAAFTVAATFTDSVESVTSNAFTLKTISQGDNMNNELGEVSTGILPSGSRDNVRWEITNANTSSGDFTLAIRRGDDQSSAKTVLETFRGVNLDPRSPNYVAKRVGSQFKTLEGSGDSVYLSINNDYPNVSKYVYVDSVNSTTLDYLNDDGEVRKPGFSGSIPVNQSGSFELATGKLAAGANFYEKITAENNTQGLEAADYTDIISLLKDKDAYPFNTIVAPGLLYDLHSTQLNSLVTNLTARGDAILPLDLVQYGSSISTVTSKAATLNTSYAASYWPWVKVFDSDLSKNVWVPASTIIPAVYAANDAASDAWFAPAGFNRGGLPGVTATERGLKRSLRDTLYDAKVNPIATFPNAGIVVYGQKTLQTKASATDRVNVRRLLITLKDFIGQVSQNLIFEPNTVATRNSFLSVVNPYLETVQQRQGLYAFKVVMDSSNNGPNVIDRNELKGTIFLQPTKTAEFIVLDFNVLPTGAEFPG